MIRNLLHTLQVKCHSVCVSRIYYLIPGLSERGRTFILFFHFDFSICLLFHYYGKLQQTHTYARKDEKHTQTNK